MKIEYVSHACLKITDPNGQALLIDPWLGTPLNFGTIYQYPPRVSSIEEVMKNVKWIYISHIHADHFCPEELKSHAPKDVNILIGNHEDKTFLREVEKSNRLVREIDFNESCYLTPSLMVQLISSDYDENNSFDSTIVINDESTATTIVANNDCYLADAKYWNIKRRFGGIDYFFAGYSPSSYYPSCFSHIKGSSVEKELTKVKARKLKEMVRAAALLQPSLTVPFAADLAYLHPDMLSHNKQRNTAEDALDVLREASLPCLKLGPGDEINSYNGQIKASGIFKDSLTDIVKYSEQNQALVEEHYQTGTAESSVVAAKLEAFLDRNLRGKIEDRIVFSFERKRIGLNCEPNEGKAQMEYHFETWMLETFLEEECSFDELMYSNRISVYQNQYPYSFLKFMKQGNFK